MRRPCHRLTPITAVAVLAGALAGSRAAHAQAPGQQFSSVAIYGLADAGATYLNNVAGRSVKQLDSGISTTSRIGFRGTEDLGDGLAAIFQLESGINVDTGTTNAAFFNRGSFVGLRQRGLGTVTLGRQYDFLYTSLPADSVPFIQGGLAAGYQGFANKAGGPPPAVDIHFGGQLYNNVIKYEHLIGDWGGGLMYGLGAENNHDKVWSAYFKYASRTLQIGAGWTRDNFTTAVFANEVYALKALWIVGPARLIANYSQGKETVFANSQAKIKPLELAADFDVGERGSIGFGYGWARAKDRAGRPAALTQPFVGTRYRFSKTTAIYAMAARNHSNDPSVIPASVNAPGGATAPSSNSNQAVVRMGIIQRF